jgi:transglutaminase-like putative cysteine protease
VVLAALLAFWPRAQRRLGFPLPALAALVTLYAVPAIALDFGAELLRGALLTLLVIAFLRLERLRTREARPAFALTAGLAVLALVLAPLFDGDDPWWDYETWALSTAAAKSTSFSWDHSYGPLGWPRDGREILRVRAQQPAYWKAQNLDLFNGRTWQEFPFRTAPGVRPETELPGNPRAERAWTQRIEVNVRNLRSRTFLTAGTALRVRPPQRNLSISLGVPTIFSAGRTLKRGDVYGARVYTPRPGTTVLRRAPSSEPRDMWRYLFAAIPAARSSAAGASADYASFPTWDQQEAGAEPAAPRDASTILTGLLESGALRRTWRLSRQLREGVETPFGYVRAVERYLADGFSYSEAPPAAAEELEGFLFEARSGYCQQYSGAMALLLRMAGIPARVASGFTSGSRDEDTGEYVVRDFDAHSWVEVWFPGIGWVTRDPTPAAAPPRSQTAEANLPSGGASQSAPDLGSERQADRSTAAVLAQEGTDWNRVALLAGLGVLTLGLLVLAVARWRRRTALDPLAELERALRRTGRAPTPDATLQALELRFGPASAASGYLRSLREARYGARGTMPPPTAAQRRGLRAELGRGAGLAGRLRAWWALPPRRS